jgi:predicted protein tyrosine phosphatase
MEKPLSMKLLFICGRNRLRSPTAERLFAGLAGIETASAGVSPDADEPLTAELLEWADVVFVMEPAHRTKAARRFPQALRHKKIVCLSITDDYAYMAPELVQLLRDRVPRSVPQLKTAEE